MAEMIKLKFPDGAVKEFPKVQQQKMLQHRLAQDLREMHWQVKLDDQLIDLKTPITEDGEIAIITPNHQKRLEILRHSSAHVLAQAVKRQFPDAKLGIGPVIENGFYYDIDSPEPITAEDLPEIEKEMKKIVDENVEIDSS